MSIKTIRTSSGRVFGYKEPKEKKSRITVNQEYDAFVKHCTKYGLSPEFYEHGCISEAGEFFYLTGFEGPKVKLKNLAGITIRVYYPNAVTMMLNQINDELAEISEKAEMLFIERDTASGKNTIKEVREEIRNRKFALEKSLTIYNGEMDDVLKDMNLSKESLNCGVLLGNSMFEFVSFREDLGDKPYVLDNIERTYDAASRFRTVSFSALKDGILKYKNSLPHNAVELNVLNEILENIKPVKKSKSKDIEVNVSLNLETEQQMFIF